ncbi:MAG: phosphonoacetaldehyde reductase [Spirochaetales bacterium]|nr:phosphonoacetaldehyde reductase [Spirochaetales bacterium]
MRQTDFFGYGSIGRLKQIITGKRFSNIFLVADRMSFESSGAKDMLEPVIGNRNIMFFSEFDPNPRIEDVKRGLALFRQHGHDVVIAVGGGSVIDMAKLIAVFADHAESPELLITQKKALKSRDIPLVAIPTTAGTGSESTHFAVVYINGEKYSVAAPSVLPDYAIVDPSLTLSMPPSVTAATGMDALSQGIESFWSVQSNRQSAEYAKQAISLAFDNLKKAVLTPDNDSREKMALAAHLSGKAINITKTTAPHAFSYYLTKKYHIPHGHAVGLMLGRFIVYNNLVTEEDVTDKRGCGYVKKTMRLLLTSIGTETAEEAREKIERLMREIGLETAMAKIGLETKGDVDAWLSRVNLERLANNPRRVEEGLIREMLPQASV